VNASRSILERSTKLTIIFSLAIALWLQARLIGLLGASAIAFAAAWAFARLRPDLARQGVLWTTYMLPAAFVVTRERYAEIYTAVWAALLCGVVLSRTELRWSLPEKWKLPLAFWGVLAACTWPIILLREADFHLDQLLLTSGWPATVAMVVMLGILWFDWLWARFGEASDRTFENEVALPLALGWVVAAAVGVYQLFGDMRFLNPGLWANLRRSTGLLGDANLFGVLSAIWGPAVVAATFARPQLRWLGMACLPLSWLALWGSGSR
jgi:hypothetical protein